MTTLKVLVGVAALAIVGAGHASAASVTSEDFAAIVGPSAAFVAASSDLAASSAGSSVLRAAARRQAETARTITAELAGWRQDQARAEVAASQAPTLDGLGPLANAVSVPLEAVARTASSPGYPFTRLPSATRIDDGSRADLARLATLSGAAFDTLYLRTDLAVLLRLERVCRDFVLNGDEPALRALAVHALPKLHREIAALEQH